MKLASQHATHVGLLAQNSFALADAGLRALGFKTNHEGQIARPVLVAVVEQLAATDRLVDKTNRQAGIDGRIRSAV